jgi:hypothetical protein
VYSSILKEIHVTIPKRRGIKIEMSIVIQLEIKRESIQKIDMKKDIVRDKRDIKIEHQRPLDLF